MTASGTSPERDQKLRRVADMMNTRHRFPFPVSQPLLDCFDAALNDREIEFILNVGLDPATKEQMLSHSGFRAEQAAQTFQALTQKGFYWTHDNQGPEEVFRLAGIMLGWFEVFLSNGVDSPEHRKFAEALDRLLRSFGKMNVFPVRNLMNNRFRSVQPAQSIVGSQKAGSQALRTIPVERKVDAEPMKIYPARTVRQLVDKHGDKHSIALVHCFCREYHKLIDGHCRFEHPPESCIVIGYFSHHAVKNSGAHYISKEEATALIDTLEKKGAVHQVFHEGEDLERPELAICNCCWDCCAVFGSYNRGFLPLNLKSFFIARMADAAGCNGCETCANHCPVRAISMKEGKACLDDAKCIGCGQCELQCPEDMFELVPMERNVFLPLKKRSEARITC